MAGLSEMKEAAKKHPDKRSVSEQALVDEARSAGITEVKNLDEAAKNDQKFNW